MQVTKKYAGGGLLSNSFEKFDDMAGAEGPIGSSYAKNRFGFGTKGGALRREKRALKKSLESGLKGPAAKKYQDRLDYLKKVQGHRAKKIGAAVGTAALIAGTAGLATGAIGAGAAGAGAAGAGAGAAGAGAAGTAATTAGGAGLSGLASKAGSLLKSDGAKKALDLASKISKGSNLPANFGGTQQQPMQSLGATPFQMPQPGGLMAPAANVGEGVLPIQEFDQPEENFDDGSGFDLMGMLQQYGNYYTGAKGVKILKGGQKKLDKNRDGKITAEDFKLLRAMLGARLPR